MANGSGSASARLTNNLQITSGTFQYQSYPQASVPTITFANGPHGPTPGAIIVPTSGLDINLSQLTAMGGLAWLQNTDGTNYVTLGIRDTSSNTFWPFMDILPGEIYTIRVSSKLPKHEVGSGTFSGSNAVLHAVANTDSVVLRVDAFDP